MLFDLLPAPFQTEHSGPIEIPDLQTLGQLSPGSVFVVLDVDPWGWDSSLPAAVGLTLMRCPLITDVLPSVLPKKLGELGGIAPLQTFGIRIKDRRRQARNREPHQLGERYATHADGVEDLLLMFLDHFLGREDPRLILVCFGIPFELKILSKHYRRLLRRFSSWVDLQDIARQLKSNESERATSPSLRETLLAFDFADEARDGRGTRAKRSAATDTVRTSWLLLRLLCLPLDATLDIKRSPRDGDSARRNRLPTPPEFFPFMAIVCRRSSSQRIIPRNMRTLFSRYKPDSWGLQSGGAHGWLAFPDLETLDRFVLEIDGSKLADDYAWEAVEFCEPEVGPAETLQESRERDRRRLDDEAGEERARKRARREDRDDDPGPLFLLT